MKRLGLALGGGGLKGFAHIGVLQVLEDSQIPVSFISGTSAGSVIAALYASGMSPYGMEKIVLELSGNGQDYLDYNRGGIIKYIASVLVPGVPTRHVDGLLSGKKFEKLMFKLTQGKSLSDVKIPLAIIACDIDTGREVIFTNQGLDQNEQNLLIINEALLSQAVRASSSIPATFAPLWFNGLQLVDGGVLNIVPVSALTYMGADYILAIDLGQEIYHEKVAGIHQIIMRSLDILEYNTSDTDESIYADMVVFPGITAVKMDDLKNADQIIRAGRRAMKEKLPLLEQSLR